MTRIAILGGGISGLTAAYELEKARRKNSAIDWHLYEASNRLGGIVQTTRQDGFILEGGPDGWVSEKPWARDLAIELGLESQLVPSNDATRKTYILLNNTLEPIPDGMRMMVPTSLAALENSTLFSPSARAAYANELTRADDLRTTAPAEDESVASFVLRHFGSEVLTKIAAPLLSGVFGGDVAKLSVRSVMPAFVAMERTHGSLIAALQSKPTTTSTSIFTSLRDGVATLTEALIAQLPADRLHLNRTALSLKRERNLWCLRTSKGTGKSKKHFNQILLATSVDATRHLLTPLNPEAAALLPTDASSALLAAFAFPTTFDLPQGFGYLVPPPTDHDTEEICHPSRSGGSASLPMQTEPTLLAATFVDQKFPHRAPPNTRILRAFFGGPSADALSHSTDAEIATAALSQLEKTLGKLPTPSVSTITRWPRSLPQYEVGHQSRITQLNEIIATIPNLTLLGNAYHGVGLPDLIRDTQSAVSRLIS